ncbi:YciI family protein [Dokdonella soli]|uniref:YciI family protein n=1 Tax=Dokdonella soli TaxID=529810 RepID=A0ABP3U5X2_9GAMM
MNRYLVIALRTPEFDPAVIGPHCHFLDKLRADDRVELSGPFSDKSGGAYLLRAATLDEATTIAHGDPLHLSGASKLTVHEWHAK